MEELGSGGVSGFHYRFYKSVELRGIGRAVGLDVDCEDALLEPHQVAHVRKRRDRVAGIVVVLAARKDADDLPLYWEEHFVLRGERLGGIDGNLVSDPATECARRMDAKHDRVALKVESSGARGTDLVGSREIVGVYAKKDRRKDSFAVREENARVDLGRDARDARKCTDRRGDIALVCNNVATHRENGDMRLEAKYLLLPLVAKARHHAPDNDDGGDAEHHAKNRNAGNDRSDRALRLKVLSSQENRKAHY